MAEMLSVPTFQLSHGQAAWVIAHGQPPPRRMLDQLRYLRLLGVPFAEGDRQPGRGNRIFYKYEEVVEMAVAIFAIRCRMRPKEVAVLLNENRKIFHELFKKALEEQPVRAVEAAWTKSQGREIPLLGNEINLPLYDRFSGASETYETFLTRSGAEQGNEKSDTSLGLAPAVGWAVKEPGGENQILVPLTRIVIEIAALARDVPDIRPGRS